MYMKIHEQGKSVILALCEKKLLGKVLKEGEVVLDLKTYASFYKGVEADEAAASNAMQSATSINLVGEKPVAIAKKLGLVKAGEVKKIGGVSHIQIYRI